MDSSLPPSSSLDLRKLRPWYLVPALILSWCVGVQRLMTAGSQASFLREARLPDITTALANLRAGGDVMEFLTVRHALELQALQLFSKVTFPLSVAQALLAGLLVVASGLAMGGRPGARALALQALGANVLFTILYYALTPGVRGAFIDAQSALSAVLPLELSRRAVLLSPDALRPEALWLSQRIEFVLGGLAPLSAVFFALTRPKARAWFEAAARAAEHAEEEEEP